MSGVYRKSEHRWFTSDGREHTSREQAQRHERALVLLAALRPFVQLDGAIPLQHAVDAILASKSIVITYPVGAPR
jgi:hypothetical protein